MHVGMKTTIGTEDLLAMTDMMTAMWATRRVADIRAVIKGAIKVAIR